MKNVLTLFAIFAWLSGHAQVSDQTFASALGLQTNFAFEKKSENLYITGQEVQGAHPTDPTLVRNVTLLSVLQNNGDSYTQLTKFPSIIPQMYDVMTNGEKYSLQDLLKHHFGDDASITIEKGEDSTAMATVVISYKGTKPMGIMTTLVKSHNSMTKAYQGLMNQHLKKFSAIKKEAHKKPLESMDNDWFPLYVGYEKLFGWSEKPDVDGAIGYWSYNNSELELSYDLYNFEDRFELYITGYVRTPEEANAYLGKFEKFAAKKGQYPGATSTEASIRPGGPAYVGVKVTYKYDGSMTVGDFAKSYKDNYYKYGDKMNKVY